jgi:hypothetical protein
MYTQMLPSDESLKYYVALLRFGLGQPRPRALAKDNKLQSSRL